MSPAPEDDRSGKHISFVLAYMVRVAGPGQRTGVDERGLVCSRRRGVWGGVGWGGWGVGFGLIKGAGRGGGPCGSDRSFKDRTREIWMKTVCLDGLLWG